VAAGYTASFVLAFVLKRGIPVGGGLLACGRRSVWSRRPCCPAISSPIRSLDDGQRHGVSRKREVHPVADGVLLFENGAGTQSMRYLAFVSVT
jgi:hypothetical protein